jgi:hypothetical protein
LIDRAQVVVCGRDRFDAQVILRHEPVQEQVEVVGSARLDEEPAAIFVDARLDRELVLEESRG